MALAYNKFNNTVLALAQKQYAFNTDTLIVALTDTAPVATNAALSSITQISYTNLSSRTLTVGSSSQSGGLYKLIVNNLTLTASGGAVAQFRYIVIYDSTATVGQELICWFDYGSEINLANGDSVALTFDATNGLFTIQ